jgi:formylglycine-generating enzyme required for sulfatase activity
MGLSPEETHGIQIGRAFYLGVYEVTQEEYEKVMGVNPSHFSRNGQGKDRIPQDTSRYPVENVSWEDAVEFCRRLSARPDEQAAHRTYRLPTEAEWEYACRGGTVGKWCCGDDEGVLKDYAWYNESSTHPVGQKKPNAWGLYDMHGNVSEWCINWFGPYPKSNANTPGPATGSERVWRGGSFNWGADYALSGMRHHATPDRRTPGYGFRVACCRSDEEKSYVLAMAKPTPPVPAKEQGAVKAKPEIPSNATPKPIDPNRAAAEVVFRHDGEIILRGDKRIYRHIEELPVREFSFSLLKTGGEPLSDDEVRTIGNIPKPEQLDQLLIDHARRVTDGGAKFIATRFPHLTCLSINISQVTDVGLAELSRLRNLKGFAIQSCPVTDAGIGHIRKLVDLDWLGLWNTSVTDDGLKELSGLQKLQILIIRDCRVTDTGLEYLRGLSSLREVHAHGTQITQEGVRRFNEARPEVKVILREGQDKSAATNEKETSTHPRSDNRQTEEKPAVVGDTRPLAVAPFGPEKARSYQEQWAKHVGVPLEQVSSVGMKFLLIPPGEFEMGSTDEEIKRVLQEKEGKPWGPAYRDRIGSEAPRHRVCIAKAFYLGTYEVTQAEYQRVMGKNPSYFSANGEGKTVVAGQDTSRFPVEQVSGEDAKEFCHRLSELPEEKKAGRTKRLPTEAEWEYACRAGAATRYGFGDDSGDLPAYAWMTPNSAGQPHPVGQNRPNAWGLYDMHGNVWEWCGDWYNSQYYRQSPLNDPPGPPSGSLVEPHLPNSGTSQVLRGAAWGSPNVDWSRCTARSPGGACSQVGFRVVCVQ